MKKKKKTQATQTQQAPVEKPAPVKKKENHSSPGIIIALIILLLFAAVFFWQKYQASRFFTPEPPLDVVDTRDSDTVALALLASKRMNVPSDKISIEMLFQYGDYAVAEAGDMTGKSNEPWYVFAVKKDGVFNEVTVQKEKEISCGMATIHPVLINFSDRETCTSIFDPTNR